MKAFDFEKAKQGKPVCTRGGKEVRILCFERVCYNDSPIVALVKNENGIENVYLYPKTGRFIDDNEDHENDLVMVSDKKKMWVNVYKVGEYFYPGDYLYEDKNRAERNRKSIEDYIGTFEIEVEV